MPTITPIPNLASAGVEVPLSLTTDQKEALVVLIDVVQYCVNRLDQTKSEPQVAGDLAIALAQVRARMEP